MYDGQSGENAISRMNGEHSSYFGHTTATARSQAVAQSVALPDEPPVADPETPPVAPPEASPSWRMLFPPHAIIPTQTEATPTAIT
jgi:hypothetical protein